MEDVEAFIPRRCTLNEQSWQAGGQLDLWPEQKLEADHLGGCSVDQGRPCSVPQECTLVRILVHCTQEVEDHTCHPSDMPVQAHIRIRRMVRLELAVHGRRRIDLRIAGVVGRRRPFDDEIRATALNISQYGTSKIATCVKGGRVREYIHDDMQEEVDPSSFSAAHVDIRQQSTQRRRARWRQ